jgi:hypothetical protein
VTRNFREQEREIQLLTAFTPTENLPGLGRARTGWFSVNEMAIFRQVQNANVARVSEGLDSEMALVWHSCDRE